MNSASPFWVLLPALATLLAGAVVGHLPDLAKPAHALRLLTAIAGAAALSAFMIVAALASGMAARLESVQHLVELCPMIPLHHAVSPALGLPAIALSARMGIRVHRVLANRRWAVRGTEGRRMLFLDTAEPIAYAAPGHPGCVVVSAGILEVLEPRERKVLFAHERAHLDQHHDRYLLVASTAVAVAPFLAPLADRIRLATERCADEAAVLAVRGDRELVAAAVARAALARSSYSSTLAESTSIDTVASFGGASVVSRVQALLDESTNTRSIALGTVTTATLLLFGVVTTSIQVHHFAVLTGHVCPT